MIKESAISSRYIRTFVAACAGLSAGAMGSAHGADTVNANFTGRITASACSVVSPNINLSLGTHDAADFDSPIGSTRGEQYFTLGIRCPSTSVRVLVTPSASNVISSNIGVFGVTGGATGVGIQLLDWRRQPVSLGTQTDYGDGHDSNWDLGYYARYYRTGTSIGAGNANGTAQFTIQYQ
ncbi:fimbrial protein [Achromobacter sp. UMC71]|uniref:fimbrial protein n=1 Tax=Achromobacter sp. UMC71 TaxID=1862320 RepID=UPI0016049C51|nr:fimbrial protein [Achromobacter sp. UMC71]MBB1628936.1 hypothetical protein [Achromobacter sp. UMC71]